MVVRLSQIFFVLLAMVLLVGPARAASNAQTEYTYTQIISEADGIAPGETMWIAIRQEVRENWHVFWINPGDAGIPLNLQWKLPEGFDVGKILHPAPEFIPVGPLASYAHEGEPVFLVPIKASESVSPGETIDVVIDAAWQACEEICVPEEARFEFDLPVLAKPVIRDDARAVFEKARSALPAVHVGDAEFSRNDDKFHLRVQSWRAANARDLFFFPATEGLTMPAAAQSARVEGDMLTLSMDPGWVDTVDAQTIDGVITYSDDAGEKHALSVAARLQGALSAASDLGASPTVSSSGGHIAWYLLLSFFGGVILNLMPCVFPIIFVKAASFMESARADRHAVRAHGLLFTAGVLAAFALMGGVLLALRAGGEQLGWGFHLQSPVVVALSAYVLFLIGLNLFGVFTIAEGLSGAGDHLTRQGGALGAFFTGALAVVVAAPCIGPLLTAPMGAALMQPAAIGMLIFLLMGLGLATPYLLLSFIPAVGRLLPRPGPWMAIMKQIMAFPVFAAAAYFLWVFSQQTGPTGLAYILAGAVLLALAVWLFEQSKGEGALALGARAASALAVLLVILPLMRLELAKAETSTAASSGYGAIATEPYDPTALAAYRAEGVSVFVDFTAAWCVTCQFNKLTVLKTADVAEAFAATGSVLMVADWTVRDPAITQALEGFGASGVPLYVFYPTGRPAQILPPALSRKIVVDALQSAS